MRRFRALAAIVLLTTAGQAAVGTYRVRRGDTLSRIAKQHGTTVADLAKANDLADPDFIREGQVLSLAAEKEAASAPAKATLVVHHPELSAKQVVVGTGERHHTIVKGENLARIARKYGTSAGALATANNLKNANAIRAGATLTIPGAKADWLCPVAARSWFSGSFGAPRPGGRAHKGTDMFAFRGTPVVAPVSGVLRHSRGSVAGNAFYLKGDDGNTYYGAHLDQLHAKPGRIARGGRIGTVGSTGNAEGTTPHLHFEIHLGGTEAIDPLPTVARWCS
ncbi:MAG: M23 family metallopeptidase [Actinobacteria bacterium]|nr:M23 family metallopeptidase [Actinomycetota bacterium]